MGQRKKLLVWTLAVVVWFFFHTILLLFVLSRNSGEVHRSSRGGDVTKLFPHSGGNNMTSEKMTSQKQMASFANVAATPRRRLSEKLRFTQHETYSDTTYKYIIGPKKMMQLNNILLNIRQRHQHPDSDYYGFNITRSEEVPVDRDVADKRPQQCKDVKYNYSALPTVSVVSPVHNEALYTLVRHVFAILLRTPNKLLKDIILVDDNSTFTYLGTDLEEYFRKLDPRIRIIRNKGREGLVKSRLHGAEVARGEVVVFLDAHMEVGPGWAEPLLDRLNSQSAIVLQPDVPGIDGNTFSYGTGQGVYFRGGFGWDLRYAWFFIPPYVSQMTSSKTDPIPTPVLVGCAIAIKKTYFNAIGQFDPGLQIWGGEHFDLSFRVWTSGGRVETVPCSKVGHVYKSNKYSYGPKGKQYILAKNLLRVAEIWMDEYKDIVYATARSLNKNLPKFTSEELRSIEERRQLKRNLKCKDFSWYLKHIIPEVKIPSKDATWFGEITNRKTKSCFYVTRDGYIGLTNLCFTFRIIPENTFTIDKWGRMLYENTCVGYDSQSLLLKLVECPCVETNASWPKWQVDANNRLTYIGPWGTLCATHVSNVAHVHKGEQMVQALHCKSKEMFQVWDFMYHLVY